MLLITLLSLIAAVPQIIVNAQTPGSFLTCSSYSLGPSGRHYFFSVVVGTKFVDARGLCSSTDTRADLAILSHPDDLAWIDSILGSNYKYVVGVRQIDTTYEPDY